MLQGMNVAALEHPWSIMVRMALWPFALGNWVMRSSVMVLKGCMEELPGMQNNRVFFFVVHILLCWHWVHPAIYFPILSQGGLQEGKRTTEGKE